MKLLIFTEGTILMHRSARGKTRRKIIEQVKKGHQSVYEWSSYVPTKGSVEKVKSWSDQATKIIYMTSRKEKSEVSQVKKVLEKYFPAGKLVYRKKGEKYKDVVKRIKPDIWVDDDCVSIGGRRRDVKLNSSLGVKEIIIPEFVGLTHLPDNLSELIKYTGD